MELPQEWPESLVPAQSLSESGVAVIPERYVRPPSQRPSTVVVPEEVDEMIKSNNIPIIDIGGLVGGTPEEETRQALSKACKEWGFFQVVNHGVSADLVERIRKVWKEFFRLPLEEKQKFANDPKNYQGYGSRTGLDKNAVLDWNDYFFLEFLPESNRRYEKWPTIPSSCRRTIEEYGGEIAKLAERLLEVLSLNLGLDEKYLKRAFGDERIGASMRMNFYPKCPQPNLTLGLGAHSDPGTLTVLLPDQYVRGLQVRKDDAWYTIDVAPDAFVINVADQLQVISNGIYKSVEHRVVVNSLEERFSLAFFLQPNEDATVGPAQELVTLSNPALYPPTNYREYRLSVRKKGTSSKTQLELLKIK